MELIIALWHRLIGTSTSSILSDIHSKISKLQDHRDRQESTAVKLDVKASKIKAKAYAVSAEAEASHKIAGKLKDLIS